MKIAFGTIPLACVLVLSACGNASDASKDKPAGEQTAEQSPAPDSGAVSSKGEQTASQAVDLKEPAADETCAYCQMEVYAKEHDLGAFTAQGVTADGKSLFFDDVGCMLNQERQEKAELKKYVRDYNSNEWLPLETANIVKADIKTPMNYGYAFFKDKADADAFAREHENAKAVRLADIDHDAKERHGKKMEHMEGGHEMKGEEHGKSESSHDR